jgi:phospholipase/carboxylesterase
MQVVNNTHVVVFQDWTLRVYLPERPERLLVLVHGYKGDENSMWVFANGLKVNYCVIAPRAPHKVIDGGYSWRPDEAKNLGQMSRESLHSQLMNLVNLIKGYAGSIGLNTKSFDMIGFSQGAALVFLLAINYPELIDKAALLGGFAPVTAGKVMVGKPLSGKKYFVAHGTRDDLVPLERSKLMVDLLERAGANITYCEDDVGHKVSSGCLRALKRYLAD